MKPLWTAHLSTDPNHAALGVVHLVVRSAAGRDRAPVHVHMVDAVPLLVDLAIAVNDYARQAAAHDMPAIQVGALHVMCADDCNGLDHTTPQQQLHAASAHIAEALLHVTAISRMPQPGMPE